MNKLFYILDVFVYYNFVNFILLHKLRSTNTNSYQVFIQRHSDVQQLMFRIRICRFNVYGLINLKIILVINPYLHVECHDITFLRFKIDSLCSFKVFFSLKNFEVMVVLLGIESKARLTDLDCDSKSNERSEHHYGTAHIVIHYVFKLRLKSFFIHNEKVNFFICNDLNSYVSSNVENLTLYILLVVLHPFICLKIFLEEQH